MARAHEETIRCIVKAGRDFNVKVMGDNLACPDMVAGAKEMEDLGCDYVIHHIGYDERRGIAARGLRMPSPLDQLRAVVAAVKVPVQAVGGLSIEQAVRTPEYGAPLVVLGAATHDRRRQFQDCLRRCGIIAAADLRKSAWIRRCKSWKLGRGSTRINADQFELSKWFDFCSDPRSSAFIRGNSSGEK